MLRRPTRRTPNEQRQNGNSQIVLHLVSPLIKDTPYLKVAEGQRFELWEACTSLVFKTSAFDHSATPPGSAYWLLTQVFSNICEPCPRVLDLIFA